MNVALRWIGTADARMGSGVGWSYGDLLGAIQRAPTVESLQFAGLSPRARLRPPDQNAAGLTNPDDLVSHRGAELTVRRVGSSAFRADRTRKRVPMEQIDRPQEHTDRPQEGTRDEPERRDEDERKPGESDSKQAADKAPMKPGSAGVASRGSGPARTGS